MTKIIKTYDDIKNYSHYKYNIQDHAIFINESALYELTFKSRMPDAHIFRDWVTSEVIPTIRKTGSYVIDEKSKKNVILMADIFMLFKLRIMIKRNTKLPLRKKCYYVPPPSNPALHIQVIDVKAPYEL